MRKLIFVIFFILSISVKSQTKDTIPLYDFMFILTSERDFNVAERLIYHSLVDNDDMNGLLWCKELKNEVNEYACEVPTVSRIVKIRVIYPILPYLSEAIEHPEQLGWLKTQMIATDIPDDWKWLISKLYIVNRNLYK